MLTDKLACTLLALSFTATHSVGHNTTWFTGWLGLATMNVISLSSGSSEPLSLVCGCEPQAEANYTISTTEMLGN